MACMKSLASVGDLARGVAPGVGGMQGTVVEMGAGRGGPCGRAMGSVKESLLELREVVERDRVERVPEDAGGESKYCSTGGVCGGRIVSDLDVFNTWRLAPDRDLVWPRWAGLESVGSSILLCATRSGPKSAAYRSCCVEAGFLGDRNAGETKFGGVKLCATCWR